MLAPHPLCCPLSQVGVVSAFAQTLRRYTSLNHLAQAARAVLQNASQINQMLSDLNRVDFANVQVTFPSIAPHCLGWGLRARAAEQGQYAGNLPPHWPKKCTNPQNSAHSRASMQVCVA